MNGDGIIKVEEFSENSGIVFHAKPLKNSVNSFRNNFNI